MQILVRVFFVGFKVIHQILINLQHQHYKGQLCQIHLQLGPFLQKGDDINNDNAAIFPFTYDNYL